MRSHVKPLVRVGRTPRSAADAHVGLLEPLSTPKVRVLGDPRGPGGPPHHARVRAPQFIWVWLWLITSAPAATFTYHIAGDDSGSWPQILGSIGLTAAAGGPANLVVVRNVAPGSAPQWMQRIEQGEMVVLEG